MTWRFRIAEPIRSNIQDDGHGGNLETLQTTSDSELLKVIRFDSLMATMVQCNIS